MSNLTQRTEKFFTAAAQNMSAIQVNLKTMKKLHDTILELYDSEDEITISEMVSMMSLQFESIERTTQSAMNVCKEFFTEAQ